MSSQRSSAGDPARTLSLLWREPEAVPTRGPERGLNIDAVVTAATGLADRDGLEAVTMRRVATQLGVAAMTLYTYVPGKAELVDVMLDAAYQRLPLTNTHGQPWRQRLGVVAQENRSLYLAHPWMASVSTVRPPLGPGLMAKYDHELHALEGLGLSDVEMDDTLTLLLSFVRDNAYAAVDVRTAQLDSAMSDEAWWAANAPLLTRILNEDAFPLAIRVGAAAGNEHGTAYDPEHAYEFGISRLLDGLAALIDAQS